MKDNEIIKAWECCTSERTNSCFKCPFYKLCDDDNFFLVKVTLDLINRQKAEIERLTTASPKTIASIKKMYATAKAEAVKEFAERLKSFLSIDCRTVTEDNPNTGDIIFGYEIDDVDIFIDNLVEEMVGEE